jgi:hypothetical protein
MVRNIIALAGLLISTQYAYNQDIDYKEISLNEAIELAKQHNVELNNAHLQIDALQYEKAKDFSFPSTNVNYYNGSFWGEKSNQMIGIQQNMGNIISSLYASKLSKSKIETQNIENEILNKNIESQTKAVWYSWQYSFAILVELEHIDSMYLKMKDYSAMLDPEKLSPSEKIRIKMASDRSALNILEAKNTLDKIGIEFRNTCGTTDYVMPIPTELSIPQIRSENDTSFYNANLYQQYWQSKVNEAYSQTKLEKSRFTPTLSAGWFSAENGTHFWQVGIGIPLFSTEKYASLKQSEIQTKRQEFEFQDNKTKFELEKEKLLTELDYWFNRMQYFRHNGMNLADSLEKSIQIDLLNNDINIETYLKSVEAITEIRTSWLEAVYQYCLIANKLSLYNF